VAFRSDGRRLVPKLREKCRGPCSVRERAECSQRFFRSTGESRDHLVGVDSNSFELGHELANNFRVRHPAPDWAGDDVLG
jgi:hypothetical protein